MFCPHCGSETELVISAGPAVAETVSAEVEIARINAERDIEVAKITARQDRDWNETRVAVAEVETEATVAAAEVEAEIIAAAIAPDAESEPEPLDIIAPAIVNDVETDIEDAPPENDGSPVPAAEKKTSFGMW